MGNRPKFLIYSALEASAALGGEGLLPYYTLIEGGRDGELFAELEDYFYYSQIRKWASMLTILNQNLQKRHQDNVPCILKQSIKWSPYGSRLWSYIFLLRIDLFEGHEDVVNL